MHFMGIVILKHCNSYDTRLIERSLRESFDGLGVDISKEVSGKKVLLKPNLLGAHLPEKAVTTHPVFVEALIRILKDCDCRLMLGDSPNGVQKSLLDVWERTGMSDLCDRYGVEKKCFEKEGAVLIDDLLISNVVFDAEYIINLPKFKTHGLTLLTAAVKNMFGIVPGLKKTDYHRTASSKADFAEILVRVAGVRRPNLNIIDGIDSMAGNGPAGGYVARLGLIAVSRDIHSADLALARLINIEPKHIDTLEAAEKLGFIDLKEGPELIGDDVSMFKMAGFKLPVTYTKNIRHSRWFRYLISKLMTNMNVRPRVLMDKCVKCGMCVDICPVSAIDWLNSYPHVDSDKCTECYCCHEVCPEQAMELCESLCLRIAKALSAHRR